MDNLYYNKKKIKKIRNNRTQRGWKIWGSILTALGLLTLLNFIIHHDDVQDLFATFFFMTPGIISLKRAFQKTRRWDEYEAIIDNQGNTPISLICERMNMSQRAVYADLQQMIQSDFFIGPNYNIQAYIDAERNMLVMSVNGRPLKPLPDLPKKEDEDKDANAEAKAGQTGQTGQAKPGQGAQASADEQAAAARKAADAKLSDLDKIRQAIPKTKDEETRSYLYGLEGSLRRIDQRVQANPALKDRTSIRRLYKFYLPQIMELINKYQSPDTPADVKEQIKDALKTSADALSNIEADFLEKDQMNLEVDIEVLKNMFAQDGLLDENSPLNAMGGRTAQSAASSATSGAASGAAQQAQQQQQ